MDAYLDIETTGFSSRIHKITVIGILKESHKGMTFVQFIDRAVTKINLSRFLSGVDIIYTYNGIRFDIPFIRNSLGVNLRSVFRMCDLMDDCHKIGLYGGLKAVEKELRIDREDDIGGRDAVNLWWKYKNGDEKALWRLLSYNREDVVNLRILKNILTGDVSV